MSLINLLIRKITLNMRLALGFGILWLLFVAVAVIGINTLNDMENSYKETIAINNQILTLVMQVNQNHHIQYSALHSYVLNRDSTEIDLYNSTRTKRDQSFKELLPLLRKENSIETWKKLNTLFQEYDRSAKEVLTAYQQSNLEVGETLFAQNKQLKDQIIQISDNWIKGIQAMNKETVADIQSKSALQKKLIYGMITGVLIIIMLLGFAVSISIAKPLIRLSKSTKEIAKGDLSTFIHEIESKDELGNLSRSVIDMAKSLRKLILDMQEISTRLSKASSELSQDSANTSTIASQVTMAIQEVAQGASEQANYVSETAKNIELLTAAIEEIAAGAEEQNRNIMITNKLAKSMFTNINQMSKKMYKIREGSAENGVFARQGGNAVGKTLEGMEQIKDSVFTVGEKIRELNIFSQQIGEIIEIIDSIAEQTNLLALNAAIEAARAGESGKGFAVVADEVRKLAERSGQATKEISQIINHIQNGTAQAAVAMEHGMREVETGVKLAQDAGNALEKILSSTDATNSDINEVGEIIDVVLQESNDVLQAIDQVSSITQENSTAAQEMTANATIVFDAMQSMSAITEENAASAEEVSASTHELSASSKAIADSAAELNDIIEQLMEHINHFNLKKQKKV